MLNYQRTILSQYANAPTINQIISSFNDYVDPSANLNAFYNLIWNVDTARGIGLDIWGRIVGVGRLLSVPVGKFFGFDEATNISADPFNQSPFYTGQVLIGNYPLTDNAYRVLILAKAMSNISDGSIRSINQILLNLFPGRGNCYVDEPAPMQMRYVFRFQLTPVESAIVAQSGALVRPAGITATYVYIP